MGTMRMTTLAPHHIMQNLPLARTTIQTLQQRTLSPRMARPLMRTMLSRHTSRMIIIRATMRMTMSMTTLAPPHIMRSPPPAKTTIQPLQQRTLSPLMTRLPRMRRPLRQTISTLHTSMIMIRATVRMTTLAPHHIMQSPPLAKTAIHPLHYPTVSPLMSRLPPHPRFITLSPSLHTMINLHMETMTTKSLLSTTVSLHIPRGPLLLGRVASMAHRSILPSAVLISPRTTRRSHLTLESNTTSPLRLVTLNATSAKGMRMAMRLAFKTKHVSHFL